MDARKRRYADWPELMHYCSLSAMPVGRFVLDVHGEDPEATWPASDAICAALQVINHLQDCGRDFRNLDRVYLPLDALAAHGVAVEDLGAERASPGLARRHRRARRALARPARTTARALADLVADTRLALEIAAIRRLAVALADGLRHRDPLSREECITARPGFALIALARRRRRARPAAVRRTAAAGRRRDSGPHECGRPRRRRGRRCRAGAAGRRQLVLPRHAHPAARSGARRCMRSTPSAAPSTTSPTATARASRAAPRSQRWRADIDRLFDGTVTAGDAPTSREPIRRFGLRREDFHAVIDGMEMDVDADLRAPDWATLDLYCDRVASAVGRLSVRIFGIDAEPGDALAHHLGRALQLTNILRDLDEDAALGRLYLPREALAAAGIRATDAPRRRSSPSRASARPAREVAARAAEHFAEADRIMAQCPRRAVRAPRLMEAAYRAHPRRELLARGWAPPRERVSHQQAAPRRRAPALRDRLMAGTVHVIGAGLSGLSAAVELADERPSASSCTRRRSSPAGAAAPITIPSSTSTSTTATTCSSPATGRRSTIFAASAARRRTDAAAGRGRVSRSPI